MHTAPGFSMVIRQLVLTKIATYYSQNHASTLVITLQLLIFHNCVNYSAIPHLPQLHASCSVIAHLLMCLQ